MKNKNSKTQARFADSKLEPVQFQFTHPSASSVCLAGTFNDWQPEAKPMHHPKPGQWLEKLILAPGAYEYCFVVDGCWMPDPLAEETVANPFGGRNSVLTVGSSPAATHRADAMNSPLNITNKAKKNKA